MEYLIQFPNFKLQLADKDKKGIWTVPFSTPLRGYVEQVDMFGNGKLQMLFASGNQLFLLDRLGRFVNPYPKKVNELILLGPKVYKTGDNGEFAIMLLHTDNTLRLYDRECRPFEAWSDITTKETIKGFPELLKVGKNRYWILKSVLKTRIYTINGIEVTRELKRFELLPNTPVKVVSDNEVIVKVTGNKNYRLNLEDRGYQKSKIMEGFITFIAVTVIIFWLIARLGPLLLRWWIKKKFGKFMDPNQSGFSDSNTIREEGEITISGNRPTEKVVDNSVGEYVDYEESKESKEN